MKVFKKGVEMKKKGFNKNDCDNSVTMCSLLLEGKRISEMSNEELARVYNETEVLSPLFEYLKAEVVRRVL